MAAHRLIHRDEFDECMVCGQTFEQATDDLAELIPCQPSATDPHVWSAVAGGAECAYCNAFVDDETPTAAIPADCIDRSSAG
ncbi:hypothetical protein SAMN05421678_106251 [Actinopolymorpha cephalotaxi]|uniref:Uncharacterized protein n=1 Tax=Actinopolymorpha cephalotaxi TaxID=504797 RepID=A0A1I2SKE5_9ACTN|nr:hypothetical protein [Actinopolymorpha cephalotaxi]SFG52983.1 hypothetical protein SAMN05421678_106251 [Actinopolymorpha cephalotaxi]